MFYFCWFYSLLAIIVEGKSAEVSHLLIVMQNTLGEKKRHARIRWNFSWEQRSLEHMCKKEVI